MPDRSMHEASVAGHGFYVPQFEVEHRGRRRCHGCAARRRRESNYHDNIDGIDSFELGVNNWDADRRAFKYIGSEDLDDMAKSRTDPKNPAAANWKIFDPCSKQVELYFGYPGQLAA